MASDIHRNRRVSVIARLGVYARHSAWIRMAAPRRINARLWFFCLREGPQLRAARSWSAGKPPEALTSCANLAAAASLIVMRPPRTRGGALASQVLAALRVSLEACGEPGVPRADSAGGGSASGEGERGGEALRERAVRNDSGELVHDMARASVLAASWVAGDGYVGSCGKRRYCARC